MKADNYQQEFRGDLLDKRLFLLLYFSASVLLLIVYIMAVNS